MCRPTRRRKARASRSAAHSRKRPDGASPLCFTPGARHDRAGRRLRGRWLVFGVFTAQSFVRSPHRDAIIELFAAASAGGVPIATIMQIPSVGSRDAVDHLLMRMLKAGEITRVGRGRMDCRPGHPGPSRMMSPRSGPRTRLFGRFALGNSDQASLIYWPRSDAVAFGWRFPSPRPAGRDRDTARATLGHGLAVSAFPRYVPV
jgi:hypothetical protein